MQGVEHNTPFREITGRRRSVALDDRPAYLLAPAPENAHRWEAIGEPGAAETVETSPEVSQGRAARSSLQPLDQVGNVAQLGRRVTQVFGAECLNGLCPAR